MIEAEILQILDVAPEFVDRYLELVESADGEPGAALVFSELADYVAGLVLDMEKYRPVLERCLAGLESVATHSHDAQELLVWSFFDGLSPDVIRHLEPWLGPRTRGLLDEADQDV